MMALLLVILLVDLSRFPTVPRKVLSSPECAFISEGLDEKVRGGVCEGGLVSWGKQWNTRSFTTAHGCSMF